jgi:hypothetical protein
MNKETIIKRDLLSISILKFIRQGLHLVIIPKKKKKLPTMFSLMFNLSTKCAQSAEITAS